MLLAILSIRLKQAFRIINDLGLLRFLFVAFLIVFLCFLSFMAINNQDGSIVISLLIVISVYLLHIKRTDRHFLRTHISNHILLQIIEYLIIAAPIIIGLIFHGELLISGLLVLVVSLITAYAKPFRQRTLNTFLQRWIPDNVYEWKGGSRRSLFWLLLILMAGLLLSFWLGSVPVAILIFGLITVGFSEKNEPLQYILVSEKPPLKFIGSKISHHLKLITIPLLPLLISFMIFHYEYWYLSVFTYLLICFIQIYAILCKYSFYVPNTRSGSQPFTMLGLLSVLLPVLLPLVIVLTIRFYFRSVSNLNLYLHDFHK